MSPKMIDISFIILTWNSAQTIDDCLESISMKCNSEDLRYEVIIVDNGSRDDTVIRIERMAKQMPVTITRHSSNRGTTRTRNIALRQSAGRIICILDSDASLREGSLRSVIDELNGDESIGILAPRMIETSGKVQISVKHFPTIGAKLARIPGILFGFPLVERGAYQGFPFEDTVDVDTAISACWFFRRSLLDRVGYLDEHIFYAPEDVDYCLRVWRKGLRICYYPGFTVYHRTQQITHKNVFSPIAFSHLYGLLYFFLKHRYLWKAPSPAGNGYSKEKLHRR